MSSGVRAEGGGALVGRPCGSGAVIDVDAERDVSSCWRRSTADASAPSSSVALSLCIGGCCSAEFSRLSDDAGLRRGSYAVGRAIRDASKCIGGGASDANQLFQSGRRLRWAPLSLASIELEDKPAAAAEAGRRLAAALPDRCPADDAAEDVIPPR